MSLIPIERDSDSLFLPPYHVAGQTPPLCRQDQAKAIGDPDRTGHVQRRSRLGHVADGAIDGPAAEFYDSGLQDPVSRSCAVLCHQGTSEGVKPGSSD